MNERYASAERREFFRYNYERPVRFDVIGGAKTKKPVSAFVDAVAKNLSASGILFTTKKLPRLSSLLTLELDDKTASVCREIEKRSLLVNHKVLGKVVRIEDADDGMYDIGVAFVTKSDSVPKDLLDRIK